MAHNHLTPPGLKTIAWNGIQFSYPDKWQIAAIGQSHLTMEGPPGPTMEVIWSRIRGRFSHKTHLKRLAAHMPKKMSAGFRVRALPSDWQAAVSGFEASGFEWRASAEHGSGVLLYCTACRRACLVHFFRHHLDGAAPGPVEILRSFKDHYGADGQLFTVFDMRATLPVPFELERYRLDAGRFELVFGHRSNRITLHRWALAAIVLKNKGLADFGQQMNLVDSEAAQEAAVGSFSGIEERRGATGAGAYMRWLAARPAHYWCRLWHVEPLNRILGVAAETRRPMNAELFERICRHYETF
jgi:hypothetical protein